jgi:hypothetical protein
MATMPARGRLDGADVSARTIYVGIERIDIDEGAGRIEMMIGS